jgi:hypothetical protein
LHLGPQSAADPCELGLARFCYRRWPIPLLRAWQVPRLSLVRLARATLRILVNICNVMPCLSMVGKSSGACSPTHLGRRSSVYAPCLRTHQSSVSLFTVQLGAFVSDRFRCLMCLEHSMWLSCTGLKALYYSCNIIQIRGLGVLPFGISGMESRNTLSR